MGKLIVLPRFQLTEVCLESDYGAIKRVTPATQVCPSRTYFYRLVSTEFDPFHPHKAHYNLLPIVLDKNGAPWSLATAYILSRLGNQVIPNMSTYHGIARDLSAFLEFLEESGIDYTDFPKNKLKRPTYRFYGFLKNKIFEGCIKASTAKRRMGTVIGYYRWLVRENIIHPANTPWVERDIQLNFKDTRGFNIDFKVKTTDVSIKAPKQIDPFTDSIVDGGCLRPIPLKEQRWLMEALAHLDNPEMKLIHALLLSTGSRIQTALTLRVRHVLDEPPKGLNEIRLPVGPSTGVDTKFDKQLTLHIPIWLYEKLRIYAYSERAKNRRKKAKHGDTNNQYLFLSQQGSPYYTSKAETLVYDPNFQLKHQKRGQTIRQFISDYIIPFVQKKYDQGFHFRVHDLRATFGMNLTDSQLQLVSQNKITLSQARQFVQSRMGHESSATTDLYLNFRQNLEQVYTAVDDHEQYLRNLFDLAWDGKLDE